MKALLLSVMLLASTVAAGCTRNVETVKREAPRVWGDAGFEVVGYEGYLLDTICGGQVWYIVRRVGDDRTRYHGFLCKWGDEFHIYNLSALDALKAQ